MLVHADIVQWSWLACMVQISLPAGALDCWVFLTCLELLDVCAKSASNVASDAASLVETYSTHVAALYDCARTKVCCLCLLLVLLFSAAQVFTLCPLYMLMYRF